MGNGLEYVIAYLRGVGYAFVTPTPLTHARVLERATMAGARDVRGIFGWSLPFEPELLPPDVLDALRSVDELEPAGDGRLRSRIRVATCDGDYFVHSAYPTVAVDSVFFGPDSYRFVRLIAAEARGRRSGRVLDIGAGSGVGAIAAARAMPGSALVMTDINPKALRYAGVNAAAAQVQVEQLLLGGDLSAVAGLVDFAVANPPYIIDDGHRAYRDGGALHGGAVSVAMTDMALQRLAPGGRFVLYTGSAIIDGHDALRAELEKLAHGFTWTYRELDPDVFGEELERPAYGDVERIAVVAAVFDKP